ncbi:lytic transglycosylase domain-containing protein [Azospirillum picis]|uniref:Soluble lytic murein transglycosylase n=1 Tax=Azospirillum picis TaxID=488438 RepID=A0ABU0MG44_9PROT|nr:lytic transglycosylase domain-containing protein [Azospirillum picis]MBP2298549.1 soluble lytic murein transglycosylase [Azospirillum picis]MDQ0532402.1 soluble lytic murein transglycosylase [Azospirillum picis]
MRTLILPASLGKSARTPVFAGLLTLFAVLPLSLATALPAAALSPQDVAIYRDAFRLAGDERVAEALARAAQAQDPLPAKVVRWMALATPGGGTFDEIAAFIRDNPDWPNMAALRRQAEMAMPDLPPAQVVEWFRQAPPLTNDGFVRYADALVATGSVDRATSLIRKQWTEGSFTADEEATFLSHYTPYLRQQDHKARIDRLLWAKQEGPVRRMLPFFDEAYDTLIEARIALDNDSTGAEAALSRVPPGLRDDPGLMFDQARSLRRRGDDAGALEIIARAGSDMGRPQSWWSERHLLARRAMERGDYNLAYRLVSANGMSEGSSFADAEFLSGFLALRFLDKPSEAFAHFHRLYRSVSAPISKARGAYWCGRAAEALGQTGPAGEWYAKAATYPTTFYGQLAFRHVSGGTVTLPAPPSVSPSESAAFDRREVVRVARLLSEIGGNADEQATSFLRRISLDAKTAADYVLAARLATQLDRRDLAVAAAKDAAQNEIFLVEAGYPLTDFRPAAPELALIHGIIRQESTFNPRIVSSAGARGLMQLMPTTAQLVAGKLGMKHTNARLTADPGYNVTLGSAYLAELIDRFNGSWVLAVAGYNAGPNRVRQWLQTYGDPRTEAIDVVDWIELIPISETRNYVQRVLEAVQVYRARLNGDRAEPNLDRDLRR